MVWDKGTVQGRTNGIGQGHGTRACGNIAGVTSGAGGTWPPLSEILEEQKFESKREER